MRKNEKAPYEVIDKIFDETHIGPIDYNQILKWQSELKKHGWTDAEFDEEMTKRIYERKSA